MLTPEGRLPLSHPSLIKYWLLKEMGLKPNDLHNIPAKFYYHLKSIQYALGKRFELESKSREAMYGRA